MTWSEEELAVINQTALVKCNNSLKQSNHPRKEKLIPSITFGNNNFFEQRVKHTSGSCPGNQWPPLFPFAATGTRSMMSSGGGGSHGTNPWKMWILKYISSILGGNFVFFYQFNFTMISAFRHSLHKLNFHIWFLYISKLNIKNSHCCALLNKDCN